MEKRNILKGASVLLIAAVMILSTFAVTANTNEIKADVAPTKGVAQGRGDFPILFEIDLPNAYSVGVGYDGEYFWVSAGDTETGFCEFYVYDELGNLVAGPVHQGGGATGWGHRDMAYDGTYMFGSYDNFFDGFSDINTYEGCFQGPINPNRAVAYDGTYFYTSGFGEQLWQVEWDGNWGSVGTAVDLGGPHNGCYGLAYDEMSDCLWMTTADYTGNLFQIDMAGNILNTYTTLPEYDIQGGCTMANTDEYGYVLVVLQQFTPDKLTFYDLGYGGPNLDCAGSLSWEDVEPGATVTGEFTVENIGDDGSLLDWEIESYPDWGTWSFDPDGGTGLLQGETETVDVEVIAPDDPETNFTGEIVLVNSDNPDDTCIIDVALATPMALSLKSQTVSLKTRSNGASPLNRDIIWDNGYPDFVNGLVCQRIGSVGIADCADDFHLTEECTIESVEWETVDDATYTWEGLDDLIVYEYTATGPGAELIDLREVENEREYLGEQWGRPWYKYTIDLIGQGDEFTLPAGDYYLLLRPYSAGTVGQSFWLTSPAPAGSTSEIYFRSDYFGYPDWVKGSEGPFAPDEYDVNFQLYGTGGEPAIPTLDCAGSLNWEDVEPGATVTGEFTVENIGDDGSLLDWAIQSYPDWGTNWTFDPNGGTNLPKGAPVTVDVEVVAPEDPETEFEGEIVLVNSEDPDNTCVIEVVLVTPVSQQSLIFQFFEMLAQRFPILGRILAAIV